MVVHLADKIVTRVSTAFKFQAELRLARENKNAQIEKMNWKAPGNSKCNLHSQLVALLSTYVIFNSENYLFLYDLTYF